MNFALITLLVLMLVASCTSQNSNRNTHNDPHIATMSCVCDSQRSVSCPTVRNCPTGIVRMCGCCPTCYRLLRAGERCDRRGINEVCQDPTVCVSSVCQRPGYQNEYQNK